MKRRDLATLLLQCPIDADIFVILPHDVLGKEREDGIAFDISVGPYVPGHSIGIKDIVFLELATAEDPRV